MKITGVCSNRSERTRMFDHLWAVDVVTTSLDCLVRSGCEVQLILCRVGASSITPS